MGGSRCGFVAEKFFFNASRRPDHLVPKDQIFAIGLQEFGRITAATPEARKFLRYRPENQADYFASIRRKTLYPFDRGGIVSTIIWPLVYVVGWLPVAAAILGAGLLFHPLYRGKVAFLLLVCSSNILISNLSTPEGREIVSRRIGAALMAGARAFRNSLAEHRAQSAKEMMEWKWAGRGNDRHYSAYVLSPSARAQILSASQGDQRSQAWMDVADSFTKIPNKEKFIERVQEEVQDGILIRPKLKGKNGAFASLAVTNLALVDLKTGKFKLVPMPKVGIGCISAMSADLDGNRIYHGYHRGGLGCRKSTRQLDAFRVPQQFN